MIKELYEKTKLSLKLKILIFFKEDQNNNYDKIVNPSMINELVFHFSLFVIFCGLDWDYWRLVWGLLLINKKKEKTKSKLLEI